MTGMVPWDANRFSDRVISSKQDKQGSSAGLERFFELVGFGDISEPCIIIDCMGSILIWYLPDIIGDGRVVSFNIFIIRRRHLNLIIRRRLMLARSV